MYGNLRSCDTLIDCCLHIGWWKIYHAYLGRFSILGRSEIDIATKADNMFNTYIGIEVNFDYISPC